MRILVLTPYAPYPPNSGGRIRIWEQLQHLGRRHDITLISFYQTEDEYDRRDAYREYCARAILVRRPDAPQRSESGQVQNLGKLFDWYSTPEMRQTLESVRSEEFDLVLCEHIFMAQYAELFSAPAALQEHNIESNIFKQVARRDHLPDGDSLPVDTDHAFRMSRWVLMRQYEDRMWPKFPLRFTVSGRDKDEMDRRCPAGRTVVIENGINTRRTTFIPDGAWPTGAPRKILFMGSLDFYPNIDSLAYTREAIMPPVWRVDPTATLMIAGRSPAQRIRDLAADPRIEVIADPDDIDAIARQCFLSIVPMRIGSGTRIKILHAMALGLPVVSTSLGCEGLTVTNGDDILIRDTPDQFAEAVLALMSDRRLANRLRTAGRALVEARYDWNSICERLECELLALVQETPPRAAGGRA